MLVTRYFEGIVRPTLAHGYQDRTFGPPLTVFRYTVALYELVRSATRTQRGDPLLARVLVAIMMQPPYVPDRARSGRNGRFRYEGRPSLAMCDYLPYSNTMRARCT